MSDREAAILRLLARGQTNAEIAAQLHLSEGTVRNQVSSVIATSNYLYADTMLAPNPLRAARTSDTVWVSYVDKPIPWRLGGAPFGAASSFDGKHWTIVTGNDDSGIWRYVEP